MLHELANYAVRYNVSGLPGFKAKNARWTIVLSQEGQFVNILEEKRQFVQAPVLEQSELVAGGITRSHFLLDAVNVVTGYQTDGDKELDKHRYFVGLLEQAAQYEQTLGKIAALLSDRETIVHMNEILKNLKAKKNDSITFRVGQYYPIELTTWHDWWQQFRYSLKPGDQSEKQRMVCLLSGEITQPLATHFKISGLNRVGGQATGTVLVGFDKDSFTSYGLEQSYNAPCSEASASLYRSALDDLIAKAPPPLAGAMFLSWFKEPVQNDDNIIDLLDNPEADEANARAKVEQLVQAVKEGKRPDLVRNRYYILQVSATGGRIMIRDWLEGEFLDLADSIRQWFSDLEIVSSNGGGRAADFKLLAGLIRLVSYRKNESLQKTRERINNEIAPLMPRIWRSILCNLPLPDTVAKKSLNYIRSKINTAGDDNTTENLDRISCALLKAWLMRNKSCEGGLAMESNLNPEHPSPAYQSGRLMAILADIQYSALGDVGAGVVQRYYAAASSTPALVLGRLVRGAQYHLNKLDKGLAVWHEKQLAEIMARLGSNLPSTLTLEGQTLFALGYYQQKAAMFNRGNRKSREEE